MAKLPPKIPNWPDFSNQKFISPYAATESNALWVDEFLDFSSARRGNHRRSISDSIAFFESSSEPVLELECGGKGRRQRASTSPMHYANAACENDNTEEYLHQFVKFDDYDEGEQLVSSMFNNEEVSLALGAPALLPPLAASNPSTPSDLGSIEDENNKQAKFANYGEATGHKLPKCEANNEVDSSIKSESEGHRLTLSPATGVATPTTSESERIVDPKRVKRILANRQSAQRSRVRKLQYISELERGVASLQAEVSVLSPRVAFLDHQRLILNVDNSALKQRIAALAQDKIFKDAHQEALKKEIERLRQVYEHQQSLKNNMDANAVADTPANVASSPSTSPLSNPKACLENEDQQLLAAN